MMNNKDIEKILAKKEAVKAPDELARTIVGKTKHMPQRQSAWQRFVLSFNRYKDAAASAVLSPQPAFAAAFLIVVSVGILQLQNSSQTNNTPLDTALSDDAYEYLYYGEFYEDWAYEQGREGVSWQDIARQKQSA